MKNTCIEIHRLFQEKQYIQLYKEYTAVINQMLLIETAADFDDFLREGFTLDENVFWLYYSAIHGQSLLIGGYEGDVSIKVTAFLKQHLPEELFHIIQDNIQQLSVNIDNDLEHENHFKKQLNICNQYLAGTDYSLQLHFDDTYCAGVYFLSVNQTI